MFELLLNALCCDLASASCDACKGTAVCRDIVCLVVMLPPVPVRDLPRDQVAVVFDLAIMAPEAAMQGGPKKQPGDLRSANASLRPKPIRSPHRGTDPPNGNTDLSF